jgi:di/tricarboxylate transporter
MMTPAGWSLAALAAAIVLSMTTRINVGLVALGLAWLIGAYGAGVPAETVARGFPSSLFVTLAGMAILFALAEANGTLEALARRFGRLARGDGRLLGPMFFAIACVLSAIGPGAVSSVALVAPLAMAIGLRTGVSPFLMALLVANGANAGNLSPVSAVGVIANSRMAGVGLGGHEAKVMLANFLASGLVALAAYVALGGYRRSTVPAPPADEIPAWTRRQIATLAGIAIWIAGVVAFRWHLGLAAVAIAMALIATRAGEESASIKRVPWGVILMVCGMSTLVALLETTGGMQLFSALLARLASAATVNGVIALVTGAISLYSSTSGVVLPAFLPTAPSIASQLGGGDPLAIALSINVGSSLVDVSPLSTLGALCLAAIPDGPDARRLFRQLMAWGVGMALAGAILCQLFAGAMARA